jgi:hypothetical protein
VCAAISLGLTSAQHPAAMALARGWSKSVSGKFHAPMMNATPRGSCLMIVLPSVLKTKPLAGTSSAAHDSTRSM